MLDINSFVDFSILSGPKGACSMFQQNIILSGTTEKDCEPTLYHEYTHYIQNMTTIHGFMSFTDYMNLFLYSFAVLGNNVQNPALPLNSYSYLQQKLGNKHLYNLIEVRSKGMASSTTGYTFSSCANNNYDLIQEEVDNKYFNKKFLLSYICIDQQKIPLNEVCIKENMALMNTIIINKILESPSAKKSTFDKLDATDIQIINNCTHKEYTVIYLFLNNYLPGKNNVELCYKICEMALNIIPIHDTIYSLLSYIKTNASTLKMETEKDIINVLSYEVSYKEKLRKLYKECKNFSKKEIANFDKIIKQDNNEFLVIVKKFYKVLLKGLKLRVREKSFYTSFLSEKYIKSFTKTIGSPIIYYNNLILPHNTYPITKVKIFKKIPSFFKKDYAYFHGTLVLYLKAYDNQLFDCPFKFNSFCNHFTNSDCLSDCLSNWGVKDFDDCILHGSLLCTGIRQDGR